MQAVTALKSLKESRIPGQNLQDRVKRDLFNVTADALLSDLTSIIIGDKRWRPLKPIKRSIEGVSRLLIVLDDYEALAPVLGDFLVESLVPRLANAPFPTLLIVACRDDLEATHPGWGQHAKRWMREQIRLAPFDEETAFSLLAEAGIAEERWASTYEATRGLPFLLTLAIEEATAPDAESALFAKKFFDRTTRWMTSREQGWFAAVCYLDTINEDTLRCLFPEREVPLVQDWFEREASIRDPASCSFRMRPVVREKVLRYLEMRSPSRHREMLQKAKGADEDDGLSRPQRDYATARPVLEECVEICRKVGDNWLLSLPYRHLEYMGFREGDYDRATALFKEGLSALRGLREKWVHRARWRPWP